MQKFNNPSNVMISLILAMIGFLSMVIVQNGFNPDPDYMPVITLILGIYFVAGLFVERHNRHFINEMVGKGKYTGVQENTTFHPESVNKTKPLQFLRLWYFVVAWPHFMWVIFKAKKKSEQ